MRRTLALLLMLAGSACSQVDVWDRVHPATMTLEVGKIGRCSATAISPNALLTAEHCLAAPLSVNGKLLPVKRVIKDGNDHALVIMRGQPFKAWARIGKRPSPGTPVFIWGNADGMSDIFRRGETMGRDGRMYVFDLNVWMGDSGSGIFNMQGEVVGVVLSMRLPFHIAGDLPLAFTKAQWAGAL